MIKTRVLLAEDEADAREILSFYLNTIFDEVVVAQDGAEGLRLYESNLKAGKKFDLILSDIKMPHVDGLEMLGRIYALDKSQKFIIVSAYQDEEKLLQSIHLRVIGYFLKPLNIDNVMDMLRQAKEEVIKEKAQMPQKIYIDAHYSYDVNEKLLYEDNKIVKLSKQETQVLDLLIKNKGKIVEIAAIKVHLWGSVEILNATFRTTIKRLKDKLEVHDFIVSRKGLGYIIE